MALVVVDQGEEIHLDLILAINYSLRLFRNDVTSGLNHAQIEALTESSFTVANFAGYANITLTGGSWTTTQGDPSEGVYAAQTFTRSSTGTAQTIFGYYVVRSSDSKLVWFEYFPGGPITVTNSGDAITVTPRYTLDDAEETAMPTGQITSYGAAVAPTGWLLCDGAAVSRTAFARLFSVIGTTYGAGDGSTTFNVPDLRQRFPLGKAAAGTGSTLGGTGGAIDHVHGLNTSSSYAAITVSDPLDQLRILRKSSGAFTSGFTLAGTVTNVGAAENTGTQLGGDSDTANPPFQVVTYIIKD